MGFPSQWRLTRKLLKKQLQKTTPFNLRERDQLLTKSFYERVKSGDIYSQEYKNAMEELREVKQQRKHYEQVIKEELQLKNYVFSQLN